MKNADKHDISPKVIGHFQYNDVIIKIISCRSALND